MGGTVWAIRTMLAVEWGGLSRAVPRSSDQLPSASRPGIPSKSLSISRYIAIYLNSLKEFQDGRQTATDPRNAGRLGKARPTRPPAWFLWPKPSPPFGPALSTLVATPLLLPRSR